MSRAYIFWLGYLSHLCLIGLIQDYQGKEKWLEMTDKFWINTEMWHWFVLIAAYLAFGLVSDYANRPRIIITQVNDLESEDDN